MLRKCVSGTGVLVLVIASTWVWAQHTPGAKFDLTRPLTMTGTVTQIDWTNPYVHVLMKVPADPLPDLWAVEVDGAILLAERGWSPDSLPLGSMIRVTGFPAKDGSHQISGNTVTLVDSGRAVYVGTNGAVPPRQRVTGAVPRGPDGRPRLGAEPGETGYWGNPSRTAMVEDGVEVDMDPWGLLADIDDAPRVAPFQPWALGIYRLRQQNQLEHDPMYLDCKPPGGPRQFQQVYGFQFVEQPDFNRVFVLLGSGNRNRRIIYTDGREHRGQLAGNDTNPLFYGHGVAEWEGDTFVVDQRGFNEEFWMDNGGLPHTEQLQLIERWTRLDKGTMQYSVTINDRGAYTRPWTSTWTLDWIPDVELPYFLCQDNRP